MGIKKKKQNDEKMLKFFRRIRQNLIDEGKLKRYLIYAFGEIILVMIGILLALQVNNWNEERKDNLKEIESLKGLENDLDKNIESLQHAINVHKSRIEDIDSIIYHLQSPTPNPNDSLLIYFQQATFYELIKISSSTYESLKSNGFEVLRDEDIKTKIIELFEMDYEGGLNTTNLVTPVYGAIGAQLRMEKNHIITKMLTGNEFKEDDTYFQLLNFISLKKEWKKNIVSGWENQLEKTLKLKIDIADYLDK
ncbi:DUF6090 family protein [Tamlana flava]|uniref:DUF6090 family protein n=1 Tax=Tamlana flava TaxID=3158572 RepID=UPI00351BA6A8